MTDGGEETVVEYDHVTIVRERREGEPDRFHVDDPLERLKTFEAQSQAELYADVYTVVGGFREDKTGDVASRQPSRPPARTSSWRI